MRAQPLCSAEHVAERGKKGSHRRVLTLFCLAFDHCLWACSAGARRAGRADSGRRALDLGATRAGAGRAVASLVSTHTRIHKNGLRSRNTGLQHILRQVGSRRALSLEHIILQIGHGRAWRNTALQDVFGHIRHGRADGKSLSTWAITVVFAGPFYSATIADRFHGARGISKSI